MSNDHLEFFDDDGESWKYQQGHYLLLHVHIQTDAQQIIIQFKKQGTYTPPYQHICFWFPATETRSICVNGQSSTLSGSDTNIRLEIATLPESNDSRSVEVNRCF